MTEIPLPTAGVWIAPSYSGDVAQVSCTITNTSDEIERSELFGHFQREPPGTFEAILHVMRAVSMLTNAGVPLRLLLDCLEQYQKLIPADATFESGQLLRFVATQQRVRFAVDAQDGETCLVVQPGDSIRTCSLDEVDECLMSPL